MKSVKPRSMQSKALTKQMEFDPLGLDREKQDKKNNQYYCARDASSLGFSYVSKTYDR